jgi:hypothetical protein
MIGLGNELAKVADRNLRLIILAHGLGGRLHHGEGRQQQIACRT